MLRVENMSSLAQGPQPIAVSLLWGHPRCCGGPGWTLSCCRRQWVRAFSSTAHNQRQWS